MCTRNLLENGNSERRKEIRNQKRFSLGSYSAELALLAKSELNLNQLELSDKTEGVPKTLSISEEAQLKSDPESEHESESPSE